MKVEIGAATQRDRLGTVVGATPPAGVVADAVYRSRAGARPWELGVVLAARASR
jgi:hypothetical protein